MDWLSDNPPIVNALSTLAIAIFTTVYAFVSAWLAFETRRLRRVHTKPRVNIRVEEDRNGSHGYELTIQNEGNGVAKNVRFCFEGDQSYFRKSWVGKAPPAVPDLPIIKKGLTYLEPGQVYRFLLGSVTSEEFDRAAQKPWTFHIKCEDLYGKHYRDTCTVDFSLFKGSMFDKNRLQEISTHLKQISESLQSIETQLKK